MDIVISVFANQNFLGAFLSSLVFILLGFFLRFRKVIGDKGKAVISALVMNIGIPCMAFAAFMSDFASDDLLDNLLIFLFALFLYVLFLLLGNLIFIKKEKTTRRIYAIFFAIGQITFFSMPLLRAIYAENQASVLIPGSMMSIAFRLMVYVYSFLVISGTKMTKDTVGPTLKKIFVSPIMIMMFLGMLIWLTQNLSFWQVSVGERTYGALRIDKTVPALFAVIKMGDQVATPLCMLLIGVTLGEVKFIEAIKNKVAWLIATLRAIVAPLLTLGLCLLLQAIGAAHFDLYSLSMLVVGMGAPVGAVVVAFAIQYDREAYMGSDAIFLSTLLCVVSIPLSLALVQLAMTLPIF